MGVVCGVQGSGSNIDICVITKDKVDYIRPYEVANAKGERFNNYTFASGTTAVLTETVTPVVLEEVVLPSAAAGSAAAMEVAADI